MTSVENTISEIYKSDSAKILAVLTRLFGTDNFSLAEDVLQDSFSKALTHWQAQGIPENPSAWIIQTAKNRAIDSFRSNKAKIKLSNDLAHSLSSDWSLGYTVDQEFSEHKIKDDQLRMIFMCCHENIKPTNRIPFILKTLCGLSIPAISRALLIPETTVKKRLLRTKKQLTDCPFEFPADDKIPTTMDSVHTVLYLLFNEGFHSSHKDKPVNLSFCQDAIGLVNVLIEEPKVANQDTLSLFALMHFHISRVDSKLDNEGNSIPLDLQDRKLWRQEYINTGKYFLSMATSAPVGASGRFFVEASIAKVHCEAEDFESTDWAQITAFYEQLITITDSPVTRLNHAIALGYSGEITQAISIVEALSQLKSLANSHMPIATLAHLNAKAGNSALAYELAETAKAKGGTPYEHRLMMAQIERLLEK
ncbi:MAG: RNA polymerase sigma factor [Leucothrix sp.]